MFPKTVIAKPTSACHRCVSRTRRSSRTKRSRAGRAAITGASTTPRRCFRTVDQSTSWPHHIEEAHPLHPRPSCGRLPVPPASRLEGDALVAVVAGVGEKTGAYFILPYKRNDGTARWYLL